MDEFTKTTGKSYPTKAFKCQCGKVFATKEVKKDTVCPKCGGSNCSPFKQTTATLPDKE